MKLTGQGQGQGQRPKIIKYFLTYLGQSRSLRHRPRNRGEGGQLPPPTFLSGGGKQHYLPPPTFSRAYIYFYCWFFAPLLGWRLPNPYLGSVLLQYCSVFAWPAPCCTCACLSPCSMSLGQVMETYINQTSMDRSGLWLILHYRAVSAAAGLVYKLTSFIDALQPRCKRL